MADIKHFTVEEITAALREYGTQVAAAAAIGCTAHTIWNYAKDYPDEIGAAIKEGRKRITAKAANNVAAKIAEGDDLNARWWLTNSPEGKAEGFGAKAQLEAVHAHLDPGHYRPEPPASWEEARQRNPKIQAAVEIGEEIAATQSILDTVLGEGAPDDEETE